MAAVPSPTASSAGTPSSSALPGGLFQGESPVSTTVLSTDPFVLFVIQASFIIIISRALGLVLGRMRQPRVIAEVIGGIILGPTVLGHVPGYSKNIFPTASLPFLNLVATIGLVLFLFIVGLEVDPTIVMREWRTTMAVGSASLVVPFGIGAAVSIAIYNEFVDTAAVSYGYFILFVGTAFCITAFPVLARILTELRLLNTSVGVIVLSAGVINDVIGWVLLALTIALVNATSGLAALYVILTGIGWIAFLVFIVRPLFVRLARRTGSLNGTGPTQLMMTVTLLLVLVSAFFTDVIGIHPIFGGFLVGVIMPHEGNFALTVAEKLEDLVTVIFLPIYFALSGLKTNLSLLDTGTIWGYIILIIALALASKILPCTLAARLNGFEYRESFTIGTLMSCKGLVELIVLNIGLQANILNATIFSMFVVMALVTTFITTPATMFLYPPSYQRRRQDERHKSRLAENARRAADLEGVEGAARPVDRHKGVLVVLHRIEALPPVMRLLKTFQRVPSKDDDDAGQTAGMSSGHSSHISLAALRLIELTERTSAVMRGASMLSYPTPLAQSSTTVTVSPQQARSQAMSLAIQYDLMLNVLMAYCHLDRISLNPFLSVIPTEHFADEALLCADREDSSLIVLPWILQRQYANQGESLGNHFSPDNMMEDTIGRSIVKSLLEKGETSIGIFVQQRNAEKSMLTQVTDVRQTEPPEAAEGVKMKEERLVLPFTGGPDDREALKLVIALVSAHGCRATIIRMVPRGANGVDEQAVVAGTKTEEVIDQDGSASDRRPSAGTEKFGFFHSILSSRKHNEVHPSFASSGSGIDTDEERLWSQCEALAGIEVKPCHHPSQFAQSFKNEILSTGHVKSLIILGRQPVWSSTLETVTLEELSNSSMIKDKAPSQIEELTNDAKHSLGPLASQLMLSCNNELLVIQAEGNTKNGNMLTRQTSHPFRKSWLRNTIVSPRESDHSSDYELDLKQTSNSDNEADQGRPHRRYRPASFTETEDRSKVR